MGTENSQDNVLSKEVESSNQKAPKACLAHDDNDNVTSGECCAMSIFILPCVEEVTLIFSPLPSR